MLRENKEPKLDHNRRSDQDWLTYCWLWSITAQHSGCAGRPESTLFDSQQLFSFCVCIPAFLRKNISSLQTPTADQLNGDSQSHWRRKSCYAGSSFLWTDTSNQTLKSLLTDTFSVGLKIDSVTVLVAVLVTWFMVSALLKACHSWHLNLKYRICKVSCAIITIMLFIAYCLYLFLCKWFICVFTVSNSMTGKFSHNDNKYFSFI